VDERQRGQLFNAHAQAGDSYAFKFDKAGIYTVKCQIHPKMKLVVTANKDLRESCSITVSPTEAPSARYPERWWSCIG